MKPGAGELEPSAWDLADVLPTRPAWHALAACRGTSTELFFPPSDEARAPAQRAYAVARAAYCAACPVTAECRSAGAHEEHGLWGGKSPSQRNRARSQVA